jgi:solute carrier family 25 (mitochondrial carnitine/acylcarnitine transporter), member 20/29
MRHNSGNKQSVYSTVTREIYKTDGLRGFYRGFWPHFWRDVPTFGAYFLSYDIYQKILLRGEDPKKAMEDKSCKVFMIKLLAGGFAGMTNWAFAYPQDVVKSFA